MLSLRVTYRRSSELQKDIDQQFARGGVLVRVAAPADLLLDTRVMLELVAPSGDAIRTEGRVLQSMPGYGVAVTFPAERLAELRALVALPARDGDALADADGATLHELVDDLDAAAPARAPAPRAPATSSSGGAGGGDVTRIEGLSNADKMHLALHGTKDERAAVLRDRNKTLHSYVLKNPQLTLEEVLAIAKNPQVAPELLKQIAERKEWYQKSQIALALARNPKTPPEVGLRMLEYVPVDALRQMAKGVGALPHIAQAARKKIIAP